MSRGRARKPAEFVSALRAAGATLSRARVPWCVIGGVAVIVRGVARFTADLDIVIEGGAADPAVVLRVLARGKIEPRFSDAEMMARAAHLLPVVHRPSGLDVDISFGWTRFEHDTIAEASEERFDRITARFATPGALVVFKAIAGRPHDLTDAESLLDLHPEIDRRRVRRDVAELADLAEDLEPVRRLDALFAKAPP